MLSHCSFALNNTGKGVCFREAGAGGHGLGTAREKLCDVASNRAPKKSYPHKLEAAGTPFL